MSSTDSTAPTPVRRAALAFIFVTVLLDMMAIGLIVPVLPSLVKHFVGGDSAHAAHVIGWFGALWGLSQFLAMPTIGAISDRIGRRPIILMSNFGLGFEYIVMALAPSLGWLFVGRIASGVTAASFSTAFAYVSDITAPQDRAKRFGFLGMAFGLGFVIGPAIGGLLGGLSPRAPFWLAAGLSLVNACWGMFVLPESLKSENRAAFNWARSNPLRGLVFLIERPAVARLALVKAINDLAHHVYPSTFALYAALRYHWNERQIGLALAFVGLAGMFVQGGAVGPIVKRLGERRALFLGLSAGAIGFCGYGLAPVGATFLMIVPVMSFWGVAGPSMQALMSKEVGPSEYGRLQGAVSGLTAATAIPGPLLFTSLYAYGISPELAHKVPGGLPGAGFLCSSLLVSASILVARAAIARRPQPAPSAAGE